MLDARQAVLTVVDVQGRLAQLMDGKETLFANLQRMVRGAQALDIPILWVEQIPAKLGPTIPELADLLAGREPIAKTSFSCARNPEFAAALRALDRRQVLVVGIEAHICVYQSALDLLRAGHEVAVVEDAIGARSAGNRLLAVHNLRAAGAAITSTEMALFEMMQDCTHPAFRQVQAIVK